VPKRGHKKKDAPLPYADDPESLGAWMKRYVGWLRVKQYATTTVERQEGYLRAFIAWSALRSLVRPQDITKPILEGYQRTLFYHRQPDGRPLSARAQHSRLVPVRAFFKWLTKNNVLLYNPAGELELPRLEYRLPKAVLTAEEAEAVMVRPDIHEPTGLRDRAILEVLYSTGMRRMEVIGLHVFDLDIERGTVMIRQGKGKKDRMVPMGQRALGWVQRYVEKARPELVVPPDDGTLFLTTMGQSITPSRMSQLVKDYVDAADLGKRGSCHLFRHTMATLMLQGGADIRFIQQMLGHVSLETTQMYTQVSIVMLKQVHEATHPAK